MRGSHAWETSYVLPGPLWEHWKIHALQNYALHPGSRTSDRELWIPSNVIRLTPTLHKMFDAGHFVIISSQRKVAFEHAYLACVYRTIVIELRRLRRNSA